MKNIFIGVDFSKKTFDVTMIREMDDSNEELGYSKFENKEKGFRAFYKWAKKTAPKNSQAQWLICGETTGVYSVGLAEWAYNKGLDVWIENAYAIKHSLGLSRGKDDKLDSSRIATYAQEKKRKAHLYKPLEGTLKELQVLLRRRQLLDTCRKAMENAVKEDLQAYSDDSVLEDVYKKIKKTADKIKEVEIEIQNKMVSLACHDVTLSNNFTIVHSFCGIGDINTIAMLVYTDNFRKFDTANQMASAWGVAPFNKQSGTSMNTPAHVSFYCNHWLKGILTCAANAAIINNDKIGGYYDRLIEKGKTKGVAYNNVKSKIIHIVFTMVQNQTKYDPYYDVKKKDKNVKRETKVLN